MVFRGKQKILHWGNSNGWEAPKDFTSHQSEWLRSKTEVTADAGEDVEKEKHSSTAGGIAFWYNKYRGIKGRDPGAGLWIEAHHRRIRRIWDGIRCFLGWTIRKGNNIWNVIKICLVVRKYLSFKIITTLCVSPVNKAHWKSPTLHLAGL